MASKEGPPARERGSINHAELNRLLAIAHGLVDGSTATTEGDLLIERMRIQKVTLPPDQAAVVLVQIDEAMTSRKTAPVRFAEALLFPLVGTVVLSPEQLKHLLDLLHEAREDPVEGIYGLCHCNAPVMANFCGPLASADLFIENLRFIRLLST